MRGIMRHRPGEFIDISSNAHRPKTHVPATENRPIKQELYLCSNSLSEETACDEGKGAKKSYGFSMV